MKPLSHTIFRTIADCYKGVNLVWQAVACIVTYLIVKSGFDWKYFLLFKNTPAYKYLFPAAIIGFFIPFLLPIVLFIIAKLRNSWKILNTAYAISQAAIIAWVVSSFYKVFTGRPGPPEQSASVAHGALIDTSRIFHFGFYRGGIFWGWPSSHTAVAFAISTVLIILYPKNKYIKIAAVLFAAYVGIGVSVSIHWFSDFVAGAILGLVVGLCVGRSFRTREAEHLEF